MQKLGAKNVEHIEIVLKWTQKYSALTRRGLESWMVAVCDVS